MYCVGDQAYHTLFIRLPARRVTPWSCQQVSELNLEEGGAFTVSSAEEILSGKAPSRCDRDHFMNNRLRMRNDDCVITM